MFSSKQLLISKTSKKTHSKIDHILELAKKNTLRLNLLLPRFYENYASMSSYLYVKASYERVIDATVFFNILYFIDEVYGEDSTTLELLPQKETLNGIWKKEIDNSQVEHIDLISRGMQSIKTIFKKNSNPRFISKLERSLNDHLSHVLSPTEYRSIDEYIDSRVHFSGMQLSLDMIEYCYDEYLDFSDDILTKAIKRIQLLCSEIGALSNDVFSYPKEKHSQFNLINALLFTSDLTSINDSIDESIHLVNNKYLEFKNLTNDIKNKYNRLSAVKNYIIYLEDIVAGSYHWQLSTGRYLSKDHFIKELQIK